jgi:hypothetical protein
LDGSDYNKPVLSSGEREASMTIEYIHDGSIQISDIINGVLVTRRYYYYAESDAINLFKNEYLKG